jgi:Mg/Co/Ni transporter MgtE
MGHRGKVIKAEDAGRLYLDRTVVAQSGKTIDEAKQAVIAEMEKQENILYVVDYDRALTTSIPQPLRDRIVNATTRSAAATLSMWPRPDGRT